MTNDDRPAELKIVIIYREKLRKSLREKLILTRAELVAMRDHILKHSTNLEGGFARTQFRGTYQLLETYTKRWNEHHKGIEKPVMIPELIIPIPTSAKSTALVKTEKPNPNPKRPWREDITANDLKFLRSLRVAPGDKLIYPEDGDDSDMDPA